MSNGSLAVVGGGVIGLSVARRAALDGWSVRVHRSGEPGASWVAGGMLAPHSEGWPRRGAAAAARPGVAWRCGTDGPGSSSTAYRRMWSRRASRWWSPSTAPTSPTCRPSADWLAAQGHPVTFTSAARDIEPLLAQGIRHGFRAETELAVDNRALVEALAAHCERLGVHWAPPVADLARCTRTSG